MKKKFGDDITIHDNLGEDGLPQSGKLVKYLGMMIGCDYDTPAALLLIQQIIMRRY